MTRSEMITAIENAKSIHQAQMHKIELVIAGDEVENPTAITKTDCECGIWFFENEKLFIEILGLQLYKRLDEGHTKWHNDYANIYNLFFKEEKKGIFSKIFSFSDDKEMIADKAKLYYEELKVDTEELFKITDSALRRVGALSSSKFSS